MSDSDVIEQFQRWLQARLAISEQIEDPSERQRAALQVESAIQLAIQYRDVVDMTPENIAPPFVEREDSVRVISDDESLSSSGRQDATICQKCDAEMTHDLEFCPACGEYP